MAGARLIGAICNSKAFSFSPTLPRVRCPLQHVECRFNQPGRAADLHHAAERDRTEEPQRLTVQSPPLSPRGVSLHRTMEEPNSRKGR